MVKLVLNRLSCPTLCDPMDCSPPGCTVLGILQPRILECIAIPFSRRSSWRRDPMHISLSFLHWQATSLPLVPPGKPSNGPWLRNMFISKTKERQWNKTWDTDWNMCMCWISDFMEATQGQAEISLPWSWRALSHSIMSWTVSPQNTDTETLTWLYLETGPLKRWLSENVAFTVSPNPFWVLSLHEKDAEHTDTTGMHTQRAARVRTQQEGGYGERPQEKPSLPTPWSWTFSLQSCETTNVCCLRHPVC